MDIDSLERALNDTHDDTLKTLIMGEIAFRYAFNEPEKGLVYSDRGLELAEKLGYNEGIAAAIQSRVYCLWAMGNYGTSLRLALETLRLYENLKDGERIAWTYLTIGVIYRDIGDFENAIVNARRGMRIYDSLQLSMRIPFAVVGSVYEKQDQLDSATYYIDEARALDLSENQGRWGWPLYLKGSIHSKNKDYDAALGYYKKALPLVIAANVRKDIVDINNGLATAFKEMGVIDSTIFYAREVFQKWNSTSYKKGVLEAVVILADAYRTANQSDSLIKYLELSVLLNSELFNQEKEREIQLLAYNEQQRLREQSEQARRFRNTLRIYALVAASGVLLIVTFFLYRNNRHKQRAFAVLQKQKQETDIQKDKAERALEALKSAQSQLIQSEKMASLGELTAGIAHEIQNPLNFVNNFSEINSELATELADAVTRGDLSEVQSIAKNIKENEDKIVNHGKRADSIVKSMMLHSRAGTSNKELTDINALCDEYCRLTYHGLRAKDKEFNASYQTNFDDTLKKINIVPQDIGRVLLNLLSNAFYAVTEKKGEAGSEYQPTVTVTTRQQNGAVEILVKDNGKGIPDAIKDKIFQPFFTTKPAGQGTGLGLSLSYDIITKGHNGSMKVESAEGSGSIFYVQLPTTKP
jgi:signal transduction histidine kinase